MSKNFQTAEPKQILKRQEDVSVDVDSHGVMETRRMLSRTVLVTERVESRTPQCPEVTVNQENYFSACSKATFLCLLPLPVLAVALFMIITGSLHFNCPAEKHIPVYFIVAGVVLLLEFLLVLLGLRYSPQSGLCYKSLFVVTCLFFVGWSITGTVWVFSVKHIVTNDVLSPHYCNLILYASSTYCAGVGVILSIVLCYCAFCSFG
ncbi:uncharacterized protein LOC135394771 isoform X1 [Ornithodoros turicata]|uniref:uncharacterized protein LOC135394771 isoform X1 n=1 Tax=Ornithodoros turicata TaxID=34597 RepID=UPI003138FF1C